MQSGLVEVDPGGDGGRHVGGAADGSLPARGQHAGHPARPARPHPVGRGPVISSMISSVIAR
jgi:hypothetical protein